MFQTRFAARAAKVAAVVALLSGAASANEGHEKHGQWMAGDFHQHTLYTDGSTPFDYVMSRNNMYGLDWWANSEHGGTGRTDGNGVPWTSYSPNPAVGSPAPSGMYRWQSLRDFVFADVLKARATYPNRRIFNGYEWNVPGHEHCSTGIVADDPSAISAFEFQFDGSDADMSRIGEKTPFGVLAKQNGRTYPGNAGKTMPERHADAVKACAWMQEQYKAGTIENGWIVFAHVERAGAWNPTSGGGYNVEHFRDFNNAGPDVCFGIEGAPGHQVEPFRGFGNAVTCSGTTCTSKDFGGTYGGVGHYTAKVGGLWDALLGEGRHFWNFASSDYHEHWSRGSSDFYPGEYQKDWAFVKGERSYNDIVDAMRSGNSFFVMGDLIDRLDFTVSQGHAKATMGETLDGRLTGKHSGPVTVKIRFHTPPFNNQGAKPAVDHVDLIAGNVTGRIDPSSPEYKNATNPSTEVVASFSAKDFVKDEDGLYSVSYDLVLDGPGYLRLRGTNLPCGTPNETGPVTALPSADYCSPLPDALMGQNDAGKAFKDLWFYSNPIFVAAK